MKSAAAEEYIASLYAVILKRDPHPDEFAHWVSAATTWPAERVYFAFVNSKEYKLKQNKPASTMRPPGHRSSPIVSPSLTVDRPKFGSAVPLGTGIENGEIFRQGWSFQDDGCRWMIDSSSVLSVPVTVAGDAADFTVLLRVQPYTANGQVDGQRCTVICGADTVAEVKLVSPVSTWIGFRVPAGAVVNGRLAILFIHPDAASPQKFGIAPDPRKLSIALHEAGLMPVTESDESVGWRGSTGNFVSSDWRSLNLDLNWKKLAVKFQSMGRDCEFGLVQRQCDAEPLGLFRFSNVQLHVLTQCLRSQFMELYDEKRFRISPQYSLVDYVSEYEGLGLFYHSFVPIDESLDVEALRRKEFTRLKMLVRLFREDLEDGEKVFVLLRREAPLDEFEVLPVISLMRRYNPKAALLWIAVAEPGQSHLVGRCELIGNNLLKGYIDRFGVVGDLRNTISLECWKDIMLSALQALGRPISARAQNLSPEQKRLEVS